MKLYTLLALSTITIASVLESKAQIDNRINFSPEWVRSGIRNAATDAADVAVFNPGGVTSLPVGFHLGLGNQSLFRSPEHSYTIADVEVSHKQDGSDPIFPSVYLAYNQGKWALTGGLFVSGGGATANFPNGSFSTELIGLMAVMGSMGAYTVAADQYMEASSFYLTTMFGGAYKINDKISLGANVRYIAAQNSTKAGFTLTGSPIMLPDMPIVIDTEAEASSFAASFGVFITPTEKLSIAARYDLMAPLDFKTSVNKDDAGLFEDGGKANRDLPAVLALGVNYKVTDKFRVELDYNYFFQTQADWEKSSMVTQERGISAMAGDAYSYALGLEYDLTEKLLFSIGGLYTVMDFQDKDGYYTSLGAFETVPGDNFSLNTGVRYKITDKIAVNAGVSNVMWEKDQEVQALMLQPMDVKVKTNNKMTAFGIGLNVSF